MLYAIKLGPIETRDDGDAFAYIGFADDVALPPEMAKRDAEGLRLLAERHGRGRDLQCEPRLAKAGKKLGFVSRPMPEWVREGRGFLAFGLGLGPYARFFVDKAPITALLAATAKFMEAEPWQWWSDSDPLSVSVMGSAGRKYEGCIMGAGGEEFGIALYENPGALERIAAAVDAGDFTAVAKEPSLSMTINFEPAWAAEAVDDAYRTKGIPMPMKLFKGKPADLDALSLTILRGTLEAVARLRPGNLLETVEMEVDGGRLRLTVEAVAPAGT